MTPTHRIIHCLQSHWVGDGFPVRSLFSYDRMRTGISPFLLLDHAGPFNFSPSNRQRGVGEHPHRGIETVTLVYKGEVDHLDSTGAGGTIFPGDVQWMTSGGGIMHQEFHSKSFTERGGELHMVQLWVNLPARDKMTAPGYQAISAADIPVFDLPEEAGQLRIIAGELGEKIGPAHTFTPLNVWDLSLQAGAEVALSQPDGWHGMVVVLSGEIMLSSGQSVGPNQVILAQSDPAHFDIKAITHAQCLILGGQPIAEPIAGYGPFVMNTQAEIDQALLDLQQGRFTRIS